MNALKYAPLAFGLLLLGIGAFFVPWRDVTPYFSRLNLMSYISILVLGVAYYVARIIRYHYMLGVLKEPLPLSKTILAYFTAQPISLLPGGEAYRVVTLNEHGDVPTSKGVSIVFIQSFTENIAMILLALASAVILNRYVLVVFGLLLLYLVIFILVRTRRTAARSHRILNKLPFVNFARSKYQSFILKNRTLLSGKSLIILILSGFISTLIASTLLFIAANDIGIHLDFAHAIVAFTLPTVLQNISFMPGGIGVNEQGTVGILTLLGSSVPAAVALTLIMRFVTLVMGVIIGLIALLIAKLLPKSYRLKTPALVREKS
jgi:uncharacterized protein (TIRG00374 family)